jgi:hypothetical protein
MYRMVERAGSRLLGLFLPRIEASAASAACGRKYFSSCWQCGYGPCDAYCCPLDGCSSVRCYA